MAIIAQTYFLLALALVVLLLEAVLRHAFLLLQGNGSLLRDALLLGQAVTVLNDLLLLLSNELLLALL